MSNHAIGGVSMAATDSTASPPKPRRRTHKRSLADRKRYTGRKDNFLSKLERYVAPESWPAVRVKIEGASDLSLEKAWQHVEDAAPKGQNAESWSAKTAETGNKVREVVMEILRNLNHKENSTGIGTTVENNPGADTDMAADSGIQPLISVSSLPPPQPPSPSPSAPPQPEANPDPRPQKRQKLSDGQYIDITGELSSEKEEQLRKRFLGSVDERAQRIISQLTNNERLNDDTIDIISKALELSLPSPKSAIKILDTMKFPVDKKTIPDKLKNDPNPDEDMYAPLYHSSTRHWTLCVLSFEPNYKVESESESGFKYIRLDFYDSWEDADRLKKVESFFEQWIKDHYPEYTIRFNRQKSAQQVDDTSCGIFALETIRRLHESQDVTDTIEPMTARGSFLDMINSLDTTSPSPSTQLQVIARIQALRNNSSKAVIRAISPSPKQQQQQSIPSPHRIITEIKGLIVQGGISITDELSSAEEKSHQLAEDEERLGSELKNAEEELDTAISNEKAFLFKILEGQLRNAFEEASKKATESMNTWLAGWGKQARKEGNTPLANDARNTHVEKVRSRKNDVQVDQIHSLIQGAIQAELDDSVKGTVEDQKKALRPFSEKVESAQTNVDGLEKQVKDVKAEKARMYSFELFYRGLSGL